MADWLEEADTRMLNYKMISQLITPVASLLDKFKEKSKQKDFRRCSYCDNKWHKLLMAKNIEQRVC